MGSAAAVVSMIAFRRMLQVSWRSPLGRQRSTVSVLMATAFVPRHPLIAGLPGSGRGDVLSS